MKTFRCNTKPAFFKALRMTATFWSAAVFRRFCGKRRLSVTRLDYHADLRAVEYHRTPEMDLPADTNGAVSRDLVSFDCHSGQDRDQLG